MKAGLQGKQRTAKALSAFSRLIQGRFSGTERLKSRYFRRWSWSSFICFYRESGFAGKITVAVEIKDKKIVAITVLNVEADDAAFFNRAKGVIDRIIQSQNLDVDVVSGATYSSVGIINAVRNALAQAAVDGSTVPASTENTEQNNQQNQSAPTPSVSGNFRIRMELIMEPQKDIWEMSR